jgi:hypothetical protein
MHLSDPFWFRLLPAPLWKASESSMGGSVKPENVQELMAQKDVDGALVGGACLDPESFARIVRCAEKGRPTSII